MEINNKFVAIVTGGASGLGAATATLLSTNGIKVAVFDTDIEKAEQIASGIGATAYACDVSSEKNVKDCLGQVCKVQGIPRILVNCAGIGTPRRIVGKQGVMPLEEFQKIINVNLVGSFNMIRLVVEQMITLDPLADGQRAVIISTASIAAFEGQIGQAAYAASKGGIVSLTLPAAREFASFGIRVNAIAPGAIRTAALSKVLTPEIERTMLSHTPLGRLGEAADIAAAALYLVAPASSWVSGQVLTVSGGGIQEID